MPLTKIGEKVKRKFIEQYGKKKGMSYFWGFMVKNRKIAKKLHKKGSGRLAKAQKTHSSRRAKKRRT